MLVSDIVNCTPHRINLFVLILVLVDVGLGHLFGHEPESDGAVLILVLVDVGLGRLTV